MKIWKRRMAFFIAVMMVAIQLIWQIPEAAFAAQTADYEYEVIGNTVKITSYIGMNQNVVIPSVIDGKPVTVIGQTAFAGVTLASLSIPYSVQEIEDFAFAQMEGVQAITIPGSVRKIGLAAFAENKDLQEVILEQGVEEIHNSAFDGNISLTSITIPASVNLIGLDCFKGCSGLQIKTLHGTFGETYGKENGYTVEYTDTSKDVSIEIRTRISSGDYDLGGKITGSQTGIYHPGDTLTLSVETEPGYEFLRWEPNISYIEDNEASSTKLHVPGNHDTIIIIAVLKTLAPKYQLTVNTDGNGKIQTDNGTQSSVSSEREAAESVSIQAVPETGYVFKNWTVTNGSVDNAASAATTFYMPAADASVTAHFEPIVIPAEYLLTIESGDHGRIIAGTSGSYKENSIVTLTASADSGYVFDQWVSSGGGSFGDDKNSSTTFMMPAENVTVRAIFKQASVTGKYHFQLKTFGPGKVTLNPDGYYNEGDIVSMSVQADSGYLFGDWFFQGEKMEVTQGTQDGKVIHTFIMPAKDTVIFLPFIGKYPYKNPVDPSQDFLFDPDSGTIIAYFGNKEIVTIPSAINGVPVKEIGTKAFSNGWTLFKNNIKQLKFEEGVTRIGEEAFAQCEYLESIQFPASLEVIGDYAFKLEYRLNSITFPTGSRLKTMGQAAFYSCGTMASTPLQLTIPSGTTSIGISAFSGANLNSVSLPDGLLSMDNLAFYNTKLAAVTIPSTVSTMGNAVFKNCSALSSVQFKNGSALKEIPASTFYGCTALQNIKLPENLEEIGMEAFYNSGLNTITWPSGGKLAVINNSFLNCKFDEVTIPASVKDARYAFTNNAKLKTVNFENGSSATDISGAFYGCTLLSTVNMPNGMEVIGNSAFKNCTGLLQFDFANTKEIGDEAFKGCTGLTTVSLPLSVESIGHSAFGGCTSLTQITVWNPNMQFNSYGWAFPDRDRQLVLKGYAGSTAEDFVKKYGSNTTLNGKGGVLFAEMNSPGFYKLTLTAGTNGKIKTSSGLYEAGKEVLLESFPNSGYMVNSWTSSGGGTFSDPLAEDTKFMMPAEAVTVTVTFKPYVETPLFGFDAVTGTILSYLGTSDVMSIPASINGIAVTAIADEAFMGNQTIDKVFIPKSVVTIGARAFKDTSISLVDMQDAYTDYTKLKLQEIKEGAFMNCTRLSQIYIPHSVTKIGSSAFENCTGFTQVRFMGINWKGITLDLGDRAFYGCTSLVDFDLGPGAEHLLVGNSTFENCVLMTGIVQSPETIGNRAYAGCTSFKETVHFSTTKTVGNSAYEGCSSITEVRLNGSTVMGKGVFKNCTSLAKVTYDSAITEMPESIFEGCTGLKTMSLPNEIISIGVRSFAESGLTRFPIAVNGAVSKVREISSGAFAGCISMTSAVFGDTLETIGADAFSGCNAMNSVSFGNKLKVIGDRAFKNTSVAGVRLSASMTVGTEAFSGNTALNSLELQGDNITLGADAFKGCSGLTGLEIRNAGIRIKENCFASCTALLTVIFYNSTTEIGTDAFPDIPSLTIKGYNGSTAQAYTAGKQIQFIPFEQNKFLFEYATGKITGYDGTLPDRIEIPKEIGGYAVKIIGEEAFKDCLSTSVFIPNTVLEIERAAFENGHIAVIDFESGSSLTNIGEMAFAPYYDFGIQQGIPGIKKLKIPASVRYIDPYAFGWNLLEELTFEKNSLLEVIGTGAFNSKGYGGTIDPPAVGIQSVEIPASVIVIEEYAFSDNPFLNTVTFESGSSLQRIQCYAFENTGVGEVVLPKGLDYLYAGSFAGCKNLRKVTFLNGKTQFDDSMTSDPNGGSKDKASHAFSGCSNLVLRGYAASTAYQYSVTSYAAANKHTFELIPEGNSVPPAFSAAAPAIPNTTSAQISGAAVSDALQAARSNAQAASGETIVKLDVTGMGNATGVEAFIPQNSFTEILKEQAPALQLLTSFGELYLSKEALQTISQGGSGEISIQIEKSSGKELPEQIQRITADSPVYQFEIKSGGNPVRQFAGDIKVTVPYVLKAGESADNIVVYYIDGNGALTEVTGSSYQNGMVTFSTNHFSTYSTVYLPERLYANRQMIMQILNYKKK